MLAYYDPNKEMFLQTDTSINGLGTYLLQQGKPVYFTSKALTEPQKGYVAIELESLAVAWTMEKVPPFPIWYPLHLRNGSTTTNSNPVKELEPGNTMIAKNSHLNIPVLFYSAPHSRTNESIS